MKKTTELEDVKPWRRYPIYKDSGIEWLGEVPEHWDVKKLKYVARIIMGQSPSSEDCHLDLMGIPFLQGNAEFTTLYPVARQFCDTARKYAEKGDILLSVRAPVGALNKADKKYGIGRGLCAIRSILGLLTDQYLWFLIQQIKSQLNIVSSGSTYDAVSVSDVANIFSLIPPLSEQQAIAQFLDQETTKIDSLVAKKERLIELLKEKRTALISHVVTKGLNPNVPLKDSGIEWLGAIPEHWEVKKLKYITILCYGDSLSSENRKNGEIAVYGSNGKIDNHHTNNTLAPCIVIGRKGSYGKIVYSVNPIFAIDTTYFIDQRFIKKNVFLRWLFYSLSLLELDKSSQDTAVPGLSREFTYNQILPLPPLSEQQAIAQFLDQETTKIDTLVAKTQTSIEKLKEYRTALISAVVTGKIDIREEV